jgi:hypothetical protein
MSDIQHLPYPHADSMRNHWWWRPGWFVGRRFYTWHLTFDGQPDLHQLVDAYQDRLAVIAGLDLIPREWLHLTIQGIDHTDEVSPAEVERITTATTARLRDIEPIHLTFHRAVVFQEAVVSPAVPAAPLDALKEALRNGIADAGAAHRLDDDPATGFRPHVSVAYNTQDRASDEIIHAVDRVDHPPVAVSVGSVQLIILDRDDGFYRWQTFATVPLGHT